ncbi:MAG: exodeoxyribonuclease VII small subunit [Candidatus Marinimicrobia bacterium]|nr:exodeoxyribonuclease VII small subunit [Candidatus Neomarinimicrobiota bacterium]|tara:strand:- start:506 stop:739 length:234 start_codon:yes stop_codon:yes gene_type:complete
MTDQNNKLTFEEGMKELEKILSKLESDQTPLEEMVDLYEKANKITEICKSRLDQANQRMTKLIKNDNGDLQEVDYEK